MKEPHDEKETRKRILLLIPHLGGGGAEKVAEQLARGLSPEKYELHLGLVNGGPLSGPGAESLSPTVKVHLLHASRVRWSGLKLLLLAHEVKPHLILSGMAHLNFLVLLLRPLFPPGTRVIVRQNTTVSKILKAGQLPFYTRFLYRWLYHRADLVLCQSEAMAEDLCVALRLPKEKIRVLLNPIEVPASRHDRSHAANGLIELVAAGRLSHEKGFDLLLQAFARLSPEFPQLRLRIAGVGPEEGALRSLCKDLLVEKQVEFAGFTKEPLADAQVFVMSSRFEGMPNALLEAAALGLPIVCTPCSEGVVELLRGQPGVWLASSVSAAGLAAALKAALKELRPGERFEHAFIEPFAFERAVAAYERVIDEELAQ